MPKLTRMALTLSLFLFSSISHVAQALQETPVVLSQRHSPMISTLSYPGKARLLLALNPELTNSLGMKFRLIPKGSFMMGSPASEKDRGSDEVQHRVTLSSDYYMQTTEVTQGQWKAVMGTSVSEQRDDVNKDWSLAGEGVNYPMYYVSWDDAQAFIRKLNARGEGQYRLPTEAEWEYAARGRSKVAYGFGGSASDLHAYGNYADKSVIGKWDEDVDSWADKNYDDGHATTAPVGDYQANAYGLHDMHGNVYEWVSDWYGAYPSSAISDPSGASSGLRRVVRGGSWNYAAKIARSACRFEYRPDARGYHLGFRLLRTR